uniref:Ig-like domain-containing protein n=1 Tax=Nothobranchius furzeri TaxID=105023 RepID=A0A8C6L5U6_NOTFU
RVSSVSGFFSLAATLTATGDPSCQHACGIMFTPPKVVVRYGDPVDANCTSLSCHNVTGMGWESPYGAVRLTKNVSSLPYKIDKVKDWEITSHCYISFSDNQSQRHKILPITVYKMPANVSVTNPPEHLLEGVTYFLKCDVRDVAPAQNLSVFWLGKKGELKKETFSEDSFTPLDVASSLDLTPRRDDHGSEIRCEARLDVFPDGGAPLTMQSQPLVLNVLCKFLTFSHFNHHELEGILSHSSMTFDCTAAGNPKPVYNWSFASSTHPEEQIKNMNKAALSPELVLSGTYSCTASNTLGSKTKYFIITEAEGTLLLLNFVDSSFYLKVAAPRSQLTVVFVVIIVLACVVYHREPRCFMSTNKIS